MFFLVKYRMRVKNDVEPGVKRVLDFKILNYTVSVILLGDAHKSEDARILDHRDSSVTPNRKGEIIIVADPCASSIGMPPMSNEPAVNLPIPRDSLFENALALEQQRDRAGVMAVLAQDAECQQPIDLMNLGDTFYMHLFGHTGGEDLTAYEFQFFFDDDVCHPVPVDGGQYHTSYTGHCEGDLPSEASGVWLLKRSEDPSNTGNYYVTYLKLEYSSSATPGPDEHKYLGHILLRCVGYGDCVKDSRIKAYFHSSLTAFVDSVNKEDSIEMKNNTVQLKNWDWPSFWNYIADAEPSENLGHKKVAFALNAVAHPTEARIDVFRFPPRTWSTEFDANLEVQARFDARYLDARNVDFETPSQLEIASEVVDVGDGRFTLLMSASELLEGEGGTYVGTMHIPIKCVPPSSDVRTTTVLRLTLGDTDACFALLLMHRECGCQTIRMARISGSVADAAVVDSP